MQTFLQMQNVIAVNKSKLMFIQYYVQWFLKRLADPTIPQVPEIIFWICFTQLNKKKKTPSNVEYLGTIEEILMVSNVAYRSTA